MVPLFADGLALLTWESATSVASTATAAALLANINIALSPAERTLFETKPIVPLGGNVPGKDIGPHSSTITTQRCTLARDHGPTMRFIPCNANWFRDNLA